MSGDLMHSDVGVQYIGHSSGCEYTGLCYVTVFGRLLAGYWRFRHPTSTRVRRAVTSFLTLQPPRPAPAPTWTAWQSSSVQHFVKSKPTNSITSTCCRHRTSVVQLVVQLSICCGFVVQQQIYNKWK